MSEEAIGVAPEGGEAPGGTRALKRALRERLEAAGHDAMPEYDAIAERAAGSHQVLGALIALTYDADPRIAWRAVHAMGRAADRVARDDPDLVRRYLRRLFWLITEESGGICWFAPQAMAEVARVHPGFADFVPITMNLLGEMADEDLQHFRPGILWAIGRLGPLAEPHMEDIRADLEAALDHPDAQVRGLAARALGEAGLGDRLIGHPGLREDAAHVTLFVDGEPVETTVAGLVKAALEGPGQAGRPSGASR